MAGNGLEGPALALWLLRAALACLAAATAAEAALLVVAAEFRHDAWQLPMLVSLLWTTALRLAALTPAAPMPPVPPLAPPLVLKQD